MIDGRLKLQHKLETLLGNDNVYFQPPESKRIKYPAIIYSRAQVENKLANNTVYKQNMAYKVTVIVKDPDSEIVSKIASLPLCIFDRHFTSDGLNHDVFTIYI